MNASETSKKSSKKKLKTALIIIAAVLAVAIVLTVVATVSLPILAVGGVWGGLNLAKFRIYSEYYSIKTDLCQNPGLNDGFVCQGICAYESENGNDKILVSGYMKDGKASRIYITDLDNNSYYVSLVYPNGDKFKGHAGGIAVSKNTVYVADGSAVWLLPLDMLLKAANGDFVQFEKSFSVNNEASYIYTDDSYLYVGEFHDGENYITDNYYKSPEGENHAIVSLYSFDMLEIYDKAELDAPIPAAIYSVRDKVQGICFTPDGKVVMSTSYGLADSVYYVYEKDAVSIIEHTDMGVPVFGFEEAPREIKGPAMAEGLDYYNGQVITLTESASDKYIFGKFFFADKIVLLDI